MGVARLNSTVYSTWAVSKQVGVSATTENSDGLLTVPGCQGVPCLVPAGRA